MYKEIEVFSQAELDAIPQDFHGRILIKFGTWDNRAVLNRRCDNARAVLCDNARAVLCDNARAVLCDNARAVLRGNARAVLRDNASAELWGNASAELFENASAVLWDNARAVLRDNASAELFENASAVLRDNASAELFENASAVLWDNASAVLWDNASAELFENASAVLWGNASAELWGNASAELWGNSQAVKASDNAKIVTHGNARVVYNPKTPKEYADHNGLECKDGRMILYKAVHKRNGKYSSDQDSDFYYEIGEKAMADRLDNDPGNDCGHGIHAASKAWCVDYGRAWDDLAILEVEMPMETMVVPANGSGKVRADWVHVVREVPLGECGLLGEMLAKRRGGK